MMKKFSISFPAEKEQVEVVERLKKFESISLSLAKKFKAQLADIADLRQSLLQRAFAGELT